MQDVPLEQRGTSDTLSDLATEIITVTKTLTDLLKSGGLPEPGLSDATKASLSSNKEIIEVRKALKEAANALRVVSYSDPYEHVQELVWSWTYFPALDTVARLRVAFIIESSTDAMHINEIAARADCPYDSAKLASCLRILAQHYIFKEVKENYFAHTRFSMTLRDENRVDFIRTSTQLAKIGPYFYEAMKRYPGSSNPRQSTFAVGTGIDGRESAFEWMLRNPEYHRRFSNGMEGTSRLAMANLQTVYPWRDLGPSVLVDIGGGKGHISMEIAKIAPQLRFIVQDTPAIVASATGIQLPEDLRGRIQFQIHDFWTVQPRRADVYLFRLIFHSWADEKVVRLIRNVLPHLRTGENGMGGRILVAESIIEAEKARPPSLMEQATINMMMMTIHNSSERTFGQYKALFERADSRFRVRQYGSGGPLASEILEAWLEE